MRSLAPAFRSSPHRLTGVILCCVALLLSACGRITGQDQIKTFLDSHWQVPLAAQGEPPARSTPLEASLAPEACGTCHLQQYQDWQTALHSKTMGAGIMWQLLKLDQDEGNRCLRCHAPLAEQKALVAQAVNWPNAPRTPPPGYVPPELAHNGLVCAACHVRQHRRYGPPGRTPLSDDPPHGGYSASAAFEDSRFCAFCHQFLEDGPRLAGKLREDTYAQWQASAYAPKQTCQSCHMPERRHLWRGIHDPDMVRKALAVELHLQPLPEGKYAVEIIARNKGAGHHFPTYLVPKVHLVLSLHAAGRPAREIARDTIGWQADTLMNREEFDTRIPAGESRRYRHVLVAPTGAWEVELRVDVIPGEHYERMFRHHQTHTELSPQSHRVLAKAIAETVAQHFTALQIRAKP